MPKKKKVIQEMVGYVNEKFVNNSIGFSSTEIPFYNILKTRIYESKECESDKKVKITIEEI